jgi:hypothetical protein
MGRKKVIDPYDFSDLKALSNDDYRFVEKVKTKDEITAIANRIYDAMLKRGDFVGNWLTNNIADLRIKGYDGVLGYQRTHIRRMVWEDDTSLETAYHKTVMEWYNKRPEAQEIYKKVVPTLNWFAHSITEKDTEGNEYKSNKYLNTEQIKQLGLHENPLNASNVLSLFEGSEARKEIELRRRQPYMEGDVVLLRKPFHGHWDHDPHRTKPVGEARYGSVMSVDLEEIDGWRGTKGSRLINVVWFGKDGGISKVPEKIIKLESRKGRQV